MIVVDFIGRVYLCTREKIYLHINYIFRPYGIANIGTGARQHPISQHRNRRDHRIAKG